MVSWVIWANRPMEIKSLIGASFQHHYMVTPWGRVKSGSGRSGRGANATSRYAIVHPSIRRRMGQEKVNLARFPNPDYTGHRGWGTSPKRRGAWLEPHQPCEMRYSSGAQPGLTTLSWSGRPPGSPGWRARLILPTAARKEPLPRARSSASAAAGTGKHTAS